MSRKIQLTGLVYNTKGGKVVDYGFEELYKASSNTAHETFTIEDTSLCPPLYETSEFHPNIDYKAKVVGIDEKNHWIQIITNGENGIIYLNHLAKYWGSVDCVRENYVKGTEIIVRFLSKKIQLNTFVEKSARLTLFKDFTYKVGDIVNIHIGPYDQTRSLVWFNGVSLEISPKFDPIFRHRINNRVYYPGYPVKGEITKIDTPNPDIRVFKFRVIHERVDYNLQPGYYPCNINENYGKRYANIKLADRSINIEIPQSEIPKDFPSISLGKFPATIRIYGFDDFGEPLVHFKSMMQELYNSHEGESFGITLARPIDNNSYFRIWSSRNGLCGMVAKSSLSALGNIKDGLDGHIINGEFIITKKGELPCQIKAGDQVTATIIERTPQFCTVNVLDKRAHLFNITGIDEAAESLEARVVFVDNTSNLILCVPADTPTIRPAGMESGSSIMLPILCNLHNSIIFGDGIHLGVMHREDWDWCDGRTLSARETTSLYTKLLIKDITPAGAFVLDRRSLFNNPWEKLGTLKGQTIEAKIEGIFNKTVTVSFEEIYTDIKWDNFCQYNINYGKFLFDTDSPVRLYVKDVDVDNRILSLGYPPQESVDPDTFFDRTTDYTAKVIKLTPVGVLIEVNGIYGIVPPQLMIAESGYTVDDSINVRFVKRMFFGKAVHFEFSHIAAIDTANIIRNCNTTMSASLVNKGNDNLVFSANGLKIYCSKYSAKYFSADKDEDFADYIIPGQTFNLRITDMQKMFAVPESMPDYSNLPSGKSYEGKIHAILENGYLISIEELNDIFYTPYAYCDWGEAHYETRKVNDTVTVTQVSYSSTLNMPYFSMIAGQEDPWSELKAGNTITVQTLGSMYKKNDFYVAVNGVPVLLSAEALCCLIGKPWIGNKLVYSSIQPLESISEFTMDILSIDLEKHKIDLMPHIEECPKTVSHAQIIRKDSHLGCIWVRCENIVGCLPEDEIPEGYEIKNFVPRAVYKDFNRKGGYVILSVKGMFSNQFIEENTDTAEPQPKGITVTGNTELKENMVVRGIVEWANTDMKRYSITVGPYHGLIRFNELSNMYCDAAQYAMDKGKEYDFMITKIDTERNNLLYLSRKPFMPQPPESIRSGEKVHAKVVRYDRQSEIIVATIDNYNGVEAYIYAADLACCKIEGHTRYPMIGFRFTAKVSSVSSNQAGTITRIKLHKGE